MELYNVISSKLLFQNRCTNNFPQSYILYFPEGILILVPQLLVVGEQGSKKKVDLCFLVLVLSRSPLFTLMQATHNAKKAPIHFSPSSLFLPLASDTRQPFSLIMCKVQTAVSSIRKKSTFEKAFRREGFLSSHYHLKTF